MIDLADNQNGTIYRNQINKVANAIKEIIFGIKKSRAGIYAWVLPLFPPALKDIATSSVSASVPENIRFAVIKNTGPTVYLAWTSFELKAKREEMVIILQKAGFNVVPCNRLSIRRKHF